MILAAGYGSRLGALGQSLPKPLLPVCGQPLVVWAVRGLSIAQVLAPDPDEIEKSVILLRRMLEVYAERPRTKD